MSDPVKRTPLIPEGIELSMVPRPDGFEGVLVEVKRTSDGLSTVMRADCRIEKLQWAATLLKHDNLLTLYLNRFDLYQNGEKLRSVTEGNWTARL
nr:MAG TPA: hypothetical protein [Caudoviricetes sp.]